MKSFRKALILALALSAPSVHANMEADPFLIKFMAEKLEVLNDAANTRQWDVQLWAGTDWHKLWLYSEGESADEKTASENLLAYSHPIAPFWDAQVGIAHDERPGARYNWGAIGINGLAPYWFETRAHLLLGEDGTLGVRASASYEALLTQFLILTPELSVAAYNGDIPKMGLGSGLSNITLGLRLRYEIRREFAPYIGVQWTQSYGKTADYLKSEGEKRGDTVLTAGLRIWF